MMALNIQNLTLEAFVEKYGDEGPFEYIDGKFVPVTPQVAGSGHLGGEFFFHLKRYVDEHNLGEVFIETPFVLTLDRSRWATGSRVPDVMFYSAAHFKQITEDYPDWESIPLVGPPDFVAEIVSPTDSFTEITEKVARYLDDGVALVWVMDRAQKLIQVHSAGSKQITSYHRDDTVSADPVIPGYELQLNQLFK